MGLFSKTSRHSDLMQRMADTVGVDMGDAILHGRLSGPDLRSAVVSCMACEGGAECGDWLDNHAAGAQTTPAYCRNQAMLMRLKDSAGA